MSLCRWPARCPVCGWPEFHEIGRLEVGDLPGITEDLAVYVCENPEGSHEFDTDDLPR